MSRHRPRHPLVALVALYCLILLLFLSSPSPSGAQGGAIRTYLPLVWLQRVDPPFGITSRVSSSTDGEESNNSAFGFDISADGRYVAFDSYASNLVSGDDNAVADIFLFDRVNGETVLISFAPGGAPANSDSLNPVLSADGRYVAFQSRATNLVSADTNKHEDIFLHDRLSGTTQLVSLTPGGFPANGDSMSPSISDDGRTIAFTSYADTLVTGDTNLTPDIFVRELESGATRRPSVATNGAQADADCLGPSISPDGRYVTFRSRAGNLVAGDTNGAQDVFIHDLRTGKTERISVASDGSQAMGHSGGGDLSAGGRYVTFGSSAANLVAGDANGQTDVFVHDRDTGETTRISISSDGSEALGLSASGSISADGRYVGFSSAAPNLVTGDANLVADLFVHDRMTGSTRRVNVSTSGAEADGASAGPRLAADGRVAVFMSAATTLVPGDRNWSTDIFVHVLPQ